MLSHKTEFMLSSAIAVAGIAFSVLDVHKRWIGYGLLALAVVMVFHAWRRQKRERLTFAPGGRGGNAAASDGGEAHGGPGGGGGLSPGGAGGDAAASGAGSLAVGGEGGEGAQPDRAARGGRSGREVYRQKMGLPPDGLEQFGRGGDSGQPGQNGMIIITYTPKKETDGPK